MHIFSNYHAYHMFFKFNQPTCKLAHLSSSQFNTIQATTHGRFFVQFTQLGTDFNHPKIEQWVVQGQPTHPTSVPLCEPEIDGHFPASCTPQHNLLNKFQHKQPKKSVDCPNELQKFQQFGPKFWDRSNGPSRPQSTQQSTKHLNKGSKQVG